MAETSSVEGAAKTPLALTEEIRKSPADPASDLEQLRAERDLLLARQKSILELLGSTKPERILHDIRNVLNERGLLRALAGIEDDRKSQ